MCGADDGVWVDWGNIGETQFTEPFFGQSIERWVRDGGGAVRRTGLGALLAVADESGGLLRAIIFHSSRCGSTLVARMLGCVPRVQILSEPGPVNDLLIDGPAQLDEANCVRALGGLVRAIGRGAGRGGFVLKTSSWNVRYHALFRAAFPGVPMVWVHRDPAEVLASVLRRPAGWSRVQHDPVLTQRLFGIAYEQAVEMTGVEYCARVLASVWDAAAEAVRGGRMQVVHYRELPDAVWTGLAPSFGLKLSPRVVEGMRAVAGLDAKAVGRAPFVRSATGLGERDRVLVDGIVRGAYERIEAAGWGNGGGDGGCSDGLVVVGLAEGRA